MALLLLILGLLHLLIGWSLLPALHGWPWLQTVGMGLLAASWLLMPMPLLAHRMRRRRLARALSAAGSWFIGLFSSLLVLALLRALLLGLAAALAWVWPAAAPTEVWRQGSALAVPALALLATLWGLRNARRVAAVREVRVPIAGLPAALHGFTIAQISDVHVGPTIRRGWLQAVVERVNALEADLVAITGDLVDGTVHELAAHVAPLSALESRHGTYFVTGNHEYYSGAHAWIDELERLGVRVLLNEHVLLRHGGAALALAGVADWSAHHFDAGHRSDPHAAIAGVADAAAVRVLLAHQPRSAIAAAAAGYHLQLSGHTHGGQFLPWNWFVRLQQPFTAGLHRLQGLWVYVSRGTGYWGPPKRLGAPSEITRLRLVKA
jgi:hypothetical protein